MTGDKYTKVVLTVIAVALLWLCMKNPMPAAKAAAEPTSKSPAYTEPGIKGVVILGVATSNTIDEFKKTGELNYMASTTGNLPVAVANTVEVTGTVGGYPVRVSQH